MTLDCAGFFEHRRTRLGLLKFAFNAENVICRLCWYMWSHFDAKNNRKTSFGGSRSFMVIDVGSNKKPVTIACYDMQHVCTYLQPFRFRTIIMKWRFFLRGISIWRLLSKHEILSRQTRVFVAAYSKDFVILACVVLTQYRSVTDRRTDGQTDGRFDDGYDARSITSSRA